MSLFTSISPPCFTLLYLLLRSSPHRFIAMSADEGERFAEFFFSSFPFFEILQLLVLQDTGIAKKWWIWKFGCICTIPLYSRYLTKWRFTIFHDTYLLSLLASAWLGRTYIMNMESRLCFTGLCWIYCNSRTQHEVLNGGRFVGMWRWMCTYWFSIYYISL